MNNIEKRVLSEIRVETRNDHRKIVGYASVFNSPANIGGFIETVRQGAFRAALDRGDDVRALIDHDPSKVLGRTVAGTLRLAEDSHGLRVEIDPPDTQIARDIMVSMERGDVNQMSFGFQVDQETWDFEGDVPQRTIESVHLHDVSVVGFPAYADTEVALRSLEALRRAANEQRGRRLAALLNELIDAMETDARPRTEIIAAMGSASGIDAGTVNQILNGDINCPPLSRLRGFARALSTSLSRLQSAAENDGCKYGDEDNSYCPVATRMRMKSGLNDRRIR